MKTKDMLKRGVPAEIPMKETIVATPTIRPKFMDRIKILFGAGIHVTVITQCQHAPGRTAGKFDYFVNKKGHVPKDIIAKVNAKVPPGADIDQSRSRA